MPNIGLPPLLPSRLHAQYTFLCHNISCTASTTMTVLTPTKRARVCVYREQGCSYHKIGLLLGCHPSTAKRAYDKFKDQRDFYRPIPNRGRPKLLDPADQRIACRLVRSGKGVLSFCISVELRYSDCIFQTQTALSILNYSYLIPQ